METKGRLRFNWILVLLLIYAAGQSFWLLPNISFWLNLINGDPNAVSWWSDTDSFSKSRADATALSFFGHVTLFLGLAVLYARTIFFAWFLALVFVVDSLLIFASSSDGRSVAMALGALVGGSIQFGLVVFAIYRITPETIDQSYLETQ
jgi:hypothetical protein